MDILDKLNAAIRYIEENLCAEFKIDVAAKKACLSTDSFLRFFSYITGMTLNEYIRRRKLTVAARDIGDKKQYIVDIAIKYGYDSAAAFSRAFLKQHGMTPSEFRKKGGSLKIYPPASFHIAVKGAKEMDFRIVELDEMKVYGVSRKYAGQGYRNREELRHIMWSEEWDDVPGKLCDGRWNQPGNTTYDGEWFGIWDNGGYMIARKSKNDDLEEYIIPAGKYAAFMTERGGNAWEELPKLSELIYESWLPDSEYVLKSDMMLEIMHLWADHDKRKRERYYEILIPVEMA